MADVRYGRARSARGSHDRHPIPARQPSALEQRDAAERLSQALAAHESSAPREEDARRQRRMALAEQFSREVATWPPEKLRRALAQPEAVLRAEVRDALLAAARAEASVERAVSELEAAVRDIEHYEYHCDGGCDYRIGMLKARDIVDGRIAALRAEGGGDG